MRKIFVMGSMNMDLVITSPYMPKAGETLCGSGFMTNPGGKGGNQAVACARQGGEVYMVGAVGNDAFGTQLKNTLAGYGVHTDYILEKPTSSGIAVIVITDSDNRIILDPGANHALCFEDFEGILRREAKPGDIFITQLETTQESVDKGIKLAKELGLYVILNPAPARTIPAETLKNVDLIIPNESEAEILTGVSTETEEGLKKAIEFFKELGVKDVIVTLGSRGAGLWKDGEIVVVPAYRVNAVDTTAAGDSFVGTLAAALSRGESLLDAMKRGNACSGIAVTREGAQQSIPTVEEVDAFMAERA